MVVQCRVCGALESECEACQWARENVLPTEEEEKLEPYYERKMKKIYRAYNEITHQFYKYTREYELPDYEA